MPKGLYIHVPFCVRKCRYCDFFSVTDLTLAEDYAHALIRNIKAYGETFDTVYFGGGTPSLLTAGQICNILSAASITANAEISMECNPNSVNKKYLSELRQTGINRLSFGIQSLSSSELHALGRLHDSGKAVAAVENAHSAGFENISADLMLATPGQTMPSLNDTIERLCRLPLTHISAYMLKIEKGTPLAADEKLLQTLPDDDKEAEMYLLTVNLLNENGFAQYEISNFAKAGRECRHNLKYWHCEEYLGIGTGAHSYLNGVRFEVPKNLNNFINSERQQTIITDSAPGSLSERLMLALRLKEGFPISEAGEYANKLTAAAVPMEKAGLLKILEDRIALTPEGFLVSNEIILRLTCLTS
ncbi:MAG: radical SAM family heme chaperone HemW [Oscillospiraceae bacterium]|nr:radical SAM family heme chaperone HemW [Oscillospiraceae bacterium]